MRQSLPADAEAAKQYGTLFNVRVYYEDTDAGGIVYHTAFLKWAERARTEWLRAKGLTDTELAKKGCVTVLSETALKLTAPARLDDQLEIYTSLTEIRGARMAFVQYVCRKSGPILARVEADVATLCPKTFRPLRASQFISA